MELTSPRAEPSPHAEPESPTPAGDAPEALVRSSSIEVLGGDSAPGATQLGHVPARKAQLPKGAIVLETGLRCFEFTDRAGRIIPVHYYVSGDFTVGDLDLGQSSSRGDEDDVNEEVAEGENDSQAGDDDGTDDGIDHHLENDEDDFEDDFFREFEEHAELMLSQTVLFVCHGVLRNAQSYCKNWISLAERYNLMIICPEFTQAAFPETAYNFGAVEKGSKQRTWAFTTIEYIFGEFLHAGLRKEGYSLFGHSAGAQFAHRMALFAPRGCRALNIVAANAGWYTNTFLTSGSYPYKWPYSLIGAPVKVKSDHLETVFGRKLLVLIGQEDVGLKYLRVTKAASAQGANRFERGLDFFLNARKLAHSLDIPFNWALQTVPLVGHSNKHMAFVTAARLFSEPLARVQVLTDDAERQHEYDEESAEGEAENVEDQLDTVAMLMSRMGEGATGDGAE